MPPARALPLPPAFPVTCLSAAWRPSPFGLADPCFTSAISRREPSPCLLLPMLGFALFVFVPSLVANASGGRSAFGSGASAARPSFARTGGLFSAAGGGAGSAFWLLKPASESFTLAVTSSVALGVSVGMPSAAAAGVFTCS